jgi:hypothetical protein
MRLQEKKGKNKKQRREERKGRNVRPNRRGSSWNKKNNNH